MNLIDPNDDCINDKYCRMTLWWNVFECEKFVLNLQFHVFIVHFKRLGSRGFHGCGFDHYLCFLSKYNET